MPTTTIHRVLHKKLHLFAYKVQLLQALLPTDRQKRVEFAVDMLQHIEHDEDFLKKVCFSDEATFHGSGTINRHNVRIWGSVTPDAGVELQ